MTLALVPAAQRRCGASVHSVSTQHELVHVDDRVITTSARTRAWMPLAAARAVQTSIAISVGDLPVTPKQPARDNRQRSADGDGEDAPARHCSH